MSVARRRADPRRDEDASAVAEFCLVMVVLVPLVLAIVQVGLVLHVRNTLTAAAADGARAASRDGASPQTGVARARSQITRALSARYAGTSGQVVEGIGQGPSSPHVGDDRAEVPRHRTVAHVGDAPQG